MKSRAFAVAALFLLAGCGGGGGGSSTPISPPPPVINPMSTATLTMTFPLPKGTGSSNRRGPQFVSPNAASMKITINSINGNTTLPSYVTPNPYTVNLTTGGGGNCVAGTGTETCTITNVPAPVGTNVSYTFQVYSLAAAAGDVLTEATVLENVVQGIVNTFTITLNGVVSAIVLNITTALTANAPNTDTDVVRVNDPSGARIVGTAAFDAGKTVAVVDNDTSGQTSLVAGTGGGSATVCSDSTHCTLSHGADTVNLVYTGRAAATYPKDSFSVVATSSAAATQTSNLTIKDLEIIFTNANIAFDSSGDGNINNSATDPTLFFATTGGNAVVLGTELGWTNSPFSQNLTYTSTTAGSGVGSTKSCAGIASISPASGSGVQYTITAVAPGVCSYVFADGVGQTKKLYVSVTNSTFNINGKNRNPQ